MKKMTATFPTKCPRCFHSFLKEDAVYPDLCPDCEEDLRRYEILEEHGESMITHPSLEGEIVELLSDCSLIRTKEDGNRYVMNATEIAELGKIDEWEAIDR